MHAHVSHVGRCGNEQSEELMAILGYALRQHVRGWFGGRSTPRRMPDRGPKPRIGASIYRGEVRMTVQAGITDELWMWLQDFGWRQLSDQSIRSRLREVPASLVTRLIDCAPEDRLRLMTLAVSRATAKPTLSSAAMGPGLLRARR
jgi:hypothetical protein